MYKMDTVKKSMTYPRRIAGGRGLSIGLEPEATSSLDDAIDVMSD